MNLRLATHRSLALAIFSLTLCACGQGVTPTDSLKGMMAASKKGDVEGMKGYLSKKTLAMMDTAGLMSGYTVDQMIKGSMEHLSEGTMPETRNEKIDGDIATLETKDYKTGEWNTTSFVKEDGRWKIALDQMLKR